MRSDKLIERFLSDWPSPSNHESIQFLMMTLNSLRAAAFLARAGLPIQTPPVQRQAVEAMVYAFLFFASPDWYPIWNQRHASDADRKKFRNAGYAAGVAEIAKANGDVASRLGKLYEVLIDVGAHPNPVALSQMVRRVPRSDGSGADVNYVLTFGQPDIDQSHSNTIEAYVLTLELVALIWPERAKDTDVTESINNLKLDAMNFCIRLIRDLNGS